MKRRAKRNYYLLITIIILSAVVLLSIGYSSFKNELAITNISSTVRIDKDIRVMGVKLNNSNKASSMYEDYNVANISFQGNLEEADSYLIYDVDVYNLGNVIMGIKSVDINNENLKVEILNYNLKDKIEYLDEVVNLEYEEWANKTPPVSRLKSMPTNPRPINPSISSKRSKGSIILGLKQERTVSFPRGRCNKDIFPPSDGSTAVAKRLNRPEKYGAIFHLFFLSTIEVQSVHPICSANLRR